MNYRVEIDGLRAVAVVPVVLFHAGIPLFSGGFVGVDVFFVISGYLIAGIILSELELGRFSLLAFYERRARRIFPALFLVIFSTAVMAWFWLPPSEMKDFSQSLIAVSIFSSNILFWLESGYWDTASELKPLLHTWSLAVEEQYYLLFPIFLMAMWRFGKRWLIGTFIFLAVVSLMASHWGAYHKPVATFYLLPTRGWEIAIGALIAFYFFLGKKSNHRVDTHLWISETLGFLGFLMIGYGVFVFDEATPFPSFYTLVPTIGTGLIILFSTEHSVVGRILSLRPLVSIGLISYSAYLWHQPLFAFTKKRTLTHPIEQSSLLLLGIALLSFLLASLSWNYVERPFRQKLKFSRKHVFSFSALGVLFCVGFGLAGQVTDGFYGRYAEDPNVFLIDYLNYDRKETYREGSCFLEPLQSHLDFEEECYSAVARDESIFLWGDSHAAALSHGLRANLNSVTQLTASACLPLVGFNSGNSPNCIDINSFVLNRIGQFRPKLVILHGNWLAPFRRNLKDLREKLFVTVSRIKSKSPNTEIVVVGGVPQWVPSLPELILGANEKLESMGSVRVRDYQDLEHVDNQLSIVSEDNEVRFISLLDLLCIDDACLSLIKKGEDYVPFAWDYGHLTHTSSLLVSNKILPLLKLD